MSQETNDIDKDNSKLNKNKNKIWTEKELDDLKNKNVKWLCIEDKVYDLTSWMEKHPGGDLIIEHMLYKDATDQFTRFHPADVKEKYLKYFQIGVRETSFMKNSPMIKDFRKFEKDLESEGYYNANYTFYFLENIKGISTLLAGIFLVIYGPDTFFNYILAAGLIAFCWHQLAFVAHDTGHNGITHNLTIDNYYGIFLASCLSGLSIGWWKDSHYVHHVVTNDPEHDPDIQHMPFLAVSERFFDGVKSTYHKKEIKLCSLSKYLLRVQHYLYYIILMFGRFNLYVQSIIFLITNKRAKYRKSELAAMIFFLTWYIKLVALIPDWKKKLVFVLLTNAMTFILHVQITISHFAMPSESLNSDDDFVTHQMKTSMDVDCPVWLDWFHGGLQFQVVHHLFPRLPRHNLRKVRDKLLPFFEKHNLNYHCYTFSLGNIIVIKHLASIARAVLPYLEEKKLL
jgi:delta8-fatty-acid desaturase